MVYAAHVVVGLGGRGSSDLWDEWFYEAIEAGAALLCLWRACSGDDRRAWAAIGAGLVFNSLGDVYFDHVLGNMANPPYPSWADAAYLASYPLLYVGMMWLIRARTPRMPVSTWLEGVVGALALASVAATFVLNPVVAPTQGNVAEVATNLAYPTFDVLLLAVVAAGFALQGSRAGRAWLLLGIGVLLDGAADAIYLVQSANGTYTYGGWVNAAWPLSSALIAVAAWTSTSPTSPAADDGDADGWRAQLLTGFFAVLIIGVLGLETLHRVPLVGHLLLTGAVLALLARLAVAGRERLQLAHSTREARTDDLTGLANRRGLYEAADHALDEGHELALVLLDVNRFKEINDTLGHNAGDELLCQLAARLTTSLAPRGVIARLGGDEFVVMLEGSDLTAALSAAESVQALLEEPFALEEFLVPIQASLGIALAPEHAGTRAELLRCADVAMYRAKARQTGIEIYQHTGDDHSRDQLRFVTELRHGLTHNQLVVHYQPKIALADNRVDGVEALVRWQHPRLGLLPPAQFVDVAEREGLMRLLTLAVLDQALAQQQQWRHAGHAIPVAVNISAANLLDTRLPEDIATTLHRYDTPPRLLELEITESTLMRDPERALDILARISELGVTFSLDDYGTGYSSLAQLRRLPVRALKIDRSFIMHMTDNDDDANIVRSTIQMAQSLHLLTVAEGVETAAHLHALTQYGCDTAQGFYLSRPIPADALTEWLQSHQPGARLTPQQENTHRAPTPLAAPGSLAPQLDH